MGKFSQEARDQCDILQAMFKKMDDLYTSLSEYFVFDKQKYTLEEFMGDIKKFKDQFKVRLIRAQWAHVNTHQCKEWPRLFQTENMASKIWWPQTFVFNCFRAHLHMAKNLPANTRRRIFLSSNIRRRGIFLCRQRFSLRRIFAGEEFFTFNLKSY